MAELIDIAARIPHAGNMVLLDSVEGWDNTGITCVARSHTDTGNPLRRGDILPAICGVEYAGQAVALHGALRSDSSSQLGLLASVREVALYARRLDEAGVLLKINAEMLAESPSSLSYRFSVDGTSGCLLEGRMTIVLT